jgi:hypothetical protein
MESPLLSARLALIIFLFSVISHLSAQTVVFSEDFSGFTTGTHSSPSTYDTSGNLDSKTGISGWTGYKVYSAAGEIKLGTSGVPGWIETPEINLSGYEGDLFVKFDISRWPDDAASVRILMNDIQMGDPIAPGDEFQTIEFHITDGTSSGKIKFESLAKRFYLDNIQVIEQNATGLQAAETESSSVKIYPNPAGDRIEVDRISAYRRCEIFNLNGILVLAEYIKESDRISIDLTSLSAGTYFIRLSSSGRLFITTFIKY